MRIGIFTKRVVLLSSRLPEDVAVINNIGGLKEATCVFGSLNFMCKQEAPAESEAALILYILEARRWKSRILVSNTNLKRRITEAN